MDKPTASAPAMAGSGMAPEQTAPTNADNVLPPNTGQGCARGLDGIPNTSTALAPSEASIQGPGAIAPAHQRLSRAVIKTPITAPTTKRSRSRPSMPKGEGQKLCSHCKSWVDKDSDGATDARKEGGDDEDEDGAENVVRLGSGEDMEM